MYNLEFLDVQYMMHVAVLVYDWDFLCLTDILLSLSSRQTAGSRHGVEALLLCGVDEVCLFSVSCIVTCSHCRRIVLILRYLCVSGLGQVSGHAPSARGLLGRPPTGRWGYVGDDHAWLHDYRV